MKPYGWVILLFALWSCRQETNTEKIPSVRKDSLNTYADIIRNPISASKPLDTVNVAKMEFSDTSHIFGTVQAGKSVSHIFSFKNTGKVPLVIQDARSTCGCTVPSFPKEPIAPGKRGSIKVVFNTENKIGRQRKPVTITANTYPNENVLYMVGEVTE